jgi:hypothetical protein
LKRGNRERKTVRVHGYFEITNFGTTNQLVGVMDKLIKTLPAILAASGSSEEVAEAAAVAAWKHAVGDALSSHTAPLQLQDKRLVVAVEDGVWQRQLEQMRGQLLFRLNAVLGQTFVKSVEFRVDPEKVRKLGHQEVSEQLNGARSSPAIPIELLAAAAQIEDPGLRRTFLGAAVSCVNRMENKD